VKVNAIFSAVRPKSGGMLNARFRKITSEQKIFNSACLYSKKVE